MKEENAMTDTITTADKLTCARRELGMRQRVYPTRVEKNLMSAGQAAHEIACMEAIVTDYEEAAKKELLV
jgi:hypothetical protein